MFNFFKPKNSVSLVKGRSGKAERDLESVTLKLSGLHCTSCAVNIDLALEDLSSVKSSTNYAKSETKVVFDPEKTNLKEIEKSITDLGYSILKD